MWPQYQPESSGFAAFCEVTPIRSMRLTRHSSIGVHGRLAPHALEESPTIRPELSVKATALGASNLPEPVCGSWIKNSPAR